jgi:hypothetical protein
MTDASGQRCGTCRWKYDDLDDFYETQCGEGYCCNGALDEHKIRWCPFCGHKIKQVKKWAK